MNNLKNIESILCASFFANTESDRHHSYYVTKGPRLKKGSSLAEVPGFSGVDSRHETGMSFVLRSKCSVLSSFIIFSF